VICFYFLSVVDRVIYYDTIIYARSVLVYCLSRFIFIW